MEQTSRRSRVAKTLSIGAAVALTGGLAWGGVDAATSGDTVINGCINKRSGALRGVATTG